MGMIHGVLNQEELLEPLADQIIVRYLKKSVQIDWATTTAYLNSCQQDFERTQLLNIDFGKVQQYLQQDLKVWKDCVMSQYKGQYRKLVNWLADNMSRHSLDRDYLIQLCVNDSRPSFVKNVARQLSKDEPRWALRGEQIDDIKPVVIRNVIGNENLVKDRLIRNLPFWFVDSGYTNFLAGKKTWHRLVKNHMHHNISDQHFPADRLGMFPQFPQPWRTGGKKILVVESSVQHYQLIGTTLPRWKDTVSKEIKKHTDRPVEFKNKSDSRKDRVTVYEQLKACPDDYYCVISDSSAAAIEAIWLGIPVITLGQHVSAPVARTQISDINDLYRGPIGEWLCALSYSQFTKNEMLNGTAIKIIRKFHHV